LGIIVGGSSSRRDQVTEQDRKEQQRSPDQERRGRGCSSSICGKAGEEEEKGPLQGQVLQLWGTGSLCEPVFKEEE